MTERISHVAPLVRWTGGNGGSWFFLIIGGEAGEAIAAHALMRRLEEGRRRGFGSVKVTARIGDSRWSTSVFPQKGEGWLLLVKAQIRKAEGIGEGDEVVLELEL